MSILSGNQQIRSNLFGKKDFALELNLGFQSHYDYLKSIAYFDPTNKIHLILFYTDDIDICLFRAAIRHKKGGHLVKPEIVTEMYESMIPLLKENIDLFFSINFLDVGYQNISKVQLISFPIG